MTSLVAPLKDPNWYKGANAYATRKTAINGLLTIALLTSSAGQLKSLMRVNPQYPFYNAVFGLLITCILGEIAAIILMLFLGRLNINHEDERSRCNLLQNILTGLAVVLLILHIMVSAFGIEELQYFPPAYYQNAATHATTVREASVVTFVPVIERWKGFADNTSVRAS